MLTVTPLACRLANNLLPHLQVAMIAAALALLGAAAVPHAASAAHAGRRLHTHPAPAPAADMPAAVPEAAMAPIRVESGECRGMGANPCRYHFAVGKYYGTVLNVCFEIEQICSLTKQKRSDIMALRWPLMPV